MTAHLPVLGDGLRPRQVVTHHVIPRVVEATVIPSGIFFVVWHFAGAWPALFAALGYAAALILRRIARGRPVPTLVVVAMLGLTARTIASIGSGSTFIYFLQPVFGTAAVSLAFFGSVMVGRPLVNKLAVQFCPLREQDANRHGVQRLFRGLTLFWASVLMVNAAITLTLLLTLSANAFVLAKTVLNPGLTCLAVTLTVVWSIRVARREGLAHHGRAAAVLA
ncbi:MAG: VC0807 family protein [Actinomycetes bacterium]